MKVERLLQICVTTMAALGTLLLGMSQDRGGLVLIALVVAVSSLVLTDFLGWFWLHRYVANVAATVAVAHSFWQSRGAGLEGQFLSVANLLIYLQIILLFQQKTRRVYWQLIVLSLLQVVVAAALNVFFLFGALVVIYLFVALTGLLLFFIYRETSPFLAAAAAGNVARRGTIQIEGVPDSTGAYLAGCSTRDPQGSMRRGMVRHIGWISVTTLVVTVIAFFLMPRYSNTVWSGPRRQTGFQPGMELDEMASILESPETVMRVRFLDHASGKSVSITGETYLRGEVLTVYSKQDRSWYRASRYVAVSDRRGAEPASNDRRSRRGNRRPWERLPEPRTSQIVRQDITLERLQQGILFAVCPAYHVGPRARRSNATRRRINSIANRRIPPKRPIYFVTAWARPPLTVNYKARSSPPRWSPSSVRCTRDGWTCRNSWHSPTTSSLIRGCRKTIGLAGLARWRITF